MSGESGEVLSRPVRTRPGIASLAAALWMAFLAFLNEGLSDHFDVGHILWPAAGAFVFTGIIIVIIDALVPIRIYKTHLRAYSGIGTPVNVYFDRIRGTSTMSLGLGSRFLVIDDGRNYFVRAYLPFRMTDPKGFYDDLVAVVGEDHILAKEMRMHGFAGLAPS